MPIPLLRTLLTLVPVLFPAAVVAAAPSDETLKTFDACVKRVKLSQPIRALGVDWKELAREWRPRADAAEPGAELRGVLNEMLATVGASHTAVLERCLYDGMMRELSGKPTPTFGVLLEEMAPGRLFVRALYEEGPGERAGLVVGDEIVRVGGVRPRGSDSVIDAGYDPGGDARRLFTFRPAEAGARLDVTIRSGERDPVRAATLVAAETSGLESGERSVRVVERGGAKIGVVHLWMVARGSGRLVQEAIRGELADCDALGVDLRGRGGLSDEIDGILAPFRAAHGKRVARGTPSWRRPGVFLTDDRTRSAKELIAWDVRHDRLGTLVGEATEGSVLGAGFFALPGGDYLELGMMEVPVADGSSLEGVGVAPDVAVAHVGPFAHGVDPILEKGLALAASSVAAAKPVKRRPI